MMEKNQHSCGNTRRAFRPHALRAQIPHPFARVAHLTHGRHTFAPQASAAFLPPLRRDRPCGRPRDVIPRHRQVPPPVEVPAAGPGRPPKGAVGRDDGVTCVRQHQPIEELYPVEGREWRRKQVSRRGAGLLMQQKGFVYLPGRPRRSGWPGRGCAATRPRCATTPRRPPLRRCSPRPR